MSGQTIIRCERCGQVYTARVSDGSFVLPTEDGCCTCGERSFEDVTDEGGAGEGDAPSP